MICRTSRQHTIVQKPRTETHLEKVAAIKKTGEEPRNSRSNPSNNRTSHILRAPAGPSAVIVRVRNPHEQKDKDGRIDQGIECAPDAPRTRPLRAAVEE